MLLLLAGYVKKKKKKNQRCRFTAKTYALKNTDTHPRTHPHTRLGRCSGRCVTRARPLLTPRVAQQGLFVWFPGTTAGGRLMWRRRGLLQPHFLRWFVCMSDCCTGERVCACVRACGAHQVGSCAMLSCGGHIFINLFFAFTRKASVWKSVVVCGGTAADNYTPTTGVKKLNALYALFSPRRFPPSLFFCLSNFLSPPFFYFLYFSLCHTLLLLLSPRRLLSLAPPPAPSTSDDFSRGVTHWASSHNVR